VQPVAVDFGPLSLHWYSLMLLAGTLAGLWLSRLLAPYRGLSPDLVTDVVVWGGAAALVGARLWYVAFKWDDVYKQAPLEALMPWRGGLAIHGGVLAGTLACLLMARRHIRQPLHLLDILAPGLLLGQAIGRWGNWFNQEAYGVPALAPVRWPAWLQDATGHLPWGIAINEHRRLPPFDDMLAWPDTTRFHPTFLYESCWDLAGLLGLMHVAFRHRPAAGKVTGLYLLIWSSGRFWIEGLRTDALMLGLPWGVVRAAQVACVLAALAGLWLIVRSFTPNHVHALEENPA
jgi:phosphatidylglycerol:prolipoprotein diacylglycerol transferase